VSAYDDCRIALIPVDGNHRAVIAPKGNLASVSPDGKHLAYSDGNKLKLATLNPEFRSQGPITIATEPHAISSIVWLPDGMAFIYQVWRGYSKLLMLGAPARARLLEAARNVEIQQVLPDGGAIGSQVLSERTLWRIDLKASTQNPERVETVPWTDRNLSLSPDGSVIAFETIRSGEEQIWVSRLDGSDARVLVQAIPHFDAVSDNTAVDGISWSPDGKWIAWSIDPEIGNGVDDARVYIVPSSGGRVRKLVELCSQDTDAPLWASDSRSIFVPKEDENFKQAFLRVDLAAGKQTPVTESELPGRARDLYPFPPDAQQSQAVGNGRYLYFERKEPRSFVEQIVILHDFLPRPTAAH